jgi:hypothetical protein
MTNWKTNLGGAIAVTGTSLIGIGVLTQLTQLSPDVALPHSVLTGMWYVALDGFILSAIGKGVTALFAADASQVDKIAQTVDKMNALGTDPGLPPTSNENNLTPEAAQPKQSPEPSGAIEPKP